MFLVMRGESREPDVSVVMGVYNGADALSSTMRSVLEQRGCALEFIVIDDGSTDGASEILDEWAARDARVRVLHQSNAGLTRALMVGCSLARAPFIARQDCGDLSLPGRLSRQLARIRANPQLSFVCCWTRVTTQEREYLYENRGRGRALEPTSIIDLDERHGVLDGPTHHGAVMFRRSSYEDAGGYRPAFYFGQDWDLWYRLAEGGLFQMLPEVLYEAHLRVSDISMNNKSQQELIGQQSVRALRLRRSGQSDQPAVDEAARIRPGAAARFGAGGAGVGWYFLGETLRRNGRREAALRYLRRSIRENPSHLKSWVRYLQARFW